MSLFEEVIDPIKGIEVHDEFLTREAVEDLLAFVDLQPWLSDLSRRVQHYGWKYDYRKRSVDSDSYLGELPPPLKQLAERIVNEGCMAHNPDQVIVNEYQPGQGIAAHIDCEPCFGPEIATLSLGDEYPMTFTHTLTREAKEVWLPVGSLCVMSGDARYLWTHEIPKRSSDIVPGGSRKARSRRVSVTFRSVLVSR